MGDLAVARGLAKVVPGAELYRYPGSTHLFTEEGYVDHDAVATDLLVDRVFALLADLT